MGQGPSGFIKVIARHLRGQVSQSQLPKEFRGKVPSHTIFGPCAHWEADGRGSLPLHHLVSDSANPH